MVLIVVDMVPCQVAVMAALSALLHTGMYRAALLHTGVCQVVLRTETCQVALLHMEKRHLRERLRKVSALRIEGYVFLPVYAISLQTIHPSVMIGSAINPV